VNASRLVWAAVLALLLVVSLFTSAPARLLYRVVPADQLLLQGLTGTVWRGSASSVSLRLPQGYLQLGAVQWSLRPLSLLLLAPHLDVRSEWGSQTLSGELILRGQSNLEVRNLEARVDANLLGRFAPLAVDGTLGLQVQGLQLRNGLPYSADGRLVWQGALWRSPRGPVPLGDYALDFHEPAGEALVGQVITLSGPLQASGAMELAGRHYQVDILLSGEEVMDEQLRQMLSLIAAPEDTGYRISVAGDF